MTRRWNQITLADPTEPPSLEILDMIGVCERTSTMSVNTMHPHLHRMTDNDAGTVETEWRLRAWIVLPDGRAPIYVEGSTPAESQDDSSAVAEAFGREVATKFVQSLMRLLADTGGDE
jgi:hypothetical protein